MFKIQFIEFQTEFEILLISGTYLTSCNSLTTDAWLLSNSTAVVRSRASILILS
jgi:hypothetical protein